MFQSSTKGSLNDRRRFFFCTILVGCSFSVACAFQADFDEWRVSLHGYLNPEIAWNTRQVVSGRKGEEVQYPKRPRRDANGCDINAEGDTTFSPFNSRLQLRVDGPPTFGADETYAFLSSDFRGISDDVREVPRLRKSYVHWRWGTRHVRFGQDNHPLYIDGCSPDRVSYAGAGFFEPNTRLPLLTFQQDRLRCDHTQHLIVQAYSHGRGLRDIGPDGRKTEYIRNAQTPAWALTYRWVYDAWAYGLIGGYKRILPRLFSRVGEGEDAPEYKDTNSLNSGYIAGYMCHDGASVSVRAHAIYGWGMQDGSMLGGYGVQHRDEATGRQEYANLATLSVWGDMTVHDVGWPGMRVGLYTAITSNLGASQPLVKDVDTGTPLVFGTQPDLGSMLRVAPRIWWRSGATELGFEVSWDRASYGELNPCGRVAVSDIVDNVHMLLGLFYYF